MAARDQSDSTRATSPLTQASGAVRIDTTALTITETVAQVLAIVRAAQDVAG
jgi:cytidylate kinase